MTINPKESENSDFISQIDKSPEDKQENLVSCVLSPENNDTNKSDVKRISQKKRSIKRLYSVFFRKRDGRCIQRQSSILTQNQEDNEGV